VLIDVTPFQPFKSRAGVDTVLGLRFAYDPAVIDTLKAALRGAGRNQGGWLAAHKRWFVERGAWPAVKAALVGAGHAVREAEDDEAPAAPKFDVTSNLHGSAERAREVLAGVVARAEDLCQRLASGAWGDGTALDPWLCFAVSGHGASAFASLDPQAIEERAARARPAPREAG
jgi:hypothetical protein